MKRVLPIGYFTFTPSLNQVNFSPMGGGFKKENLYAVINITTGKLVYAVASVSSGFGGTFAGTVLTYSSSNVGQLASDTLQVIYDDETFTQYISGSVTIQDPANVQGMVGSADAVASAIHDGSGTYQILSTPDPLTLREGLDIHVQSASVQGLLNNPLPLPYQNQALSVGYINGGDLVAPKMNIGTNELIVDATQSGPVPVDITGNSGTITVDIGSTLTPLDINLQSSAITLPVSAASLPLPSGASTDSTISTMSAKLPATLGQKTMANSMAVVVASDQSTLNTSLPDLYITGASNSAAGNNNLLASAGPGELDVSGYKSASVQVISTATSGTFIFEGSNSTVTGTFQPIPAFRIDSASPNAILTAITATATNLIYIIPVRFKYMRMRVVTGLSTPIQALTRLSQDPFVSPVHQVINATAGNLNATVAGSLTSVGTITTVTGVTTVSTVTSAALAATVFTDIASAAITTTLTSANVITSNQQNMAFQVSVTAVSGTNPTLDVVVQETFDGTTYYDIYHFPRITAIGQYRSPQIRTTGSGIRYIRTVGGITPSFTNSVNRPVRQTSSDLFRNFIDRTIDPNTLSSTTPVFLADGCDQLQLSITMNAGGTAPVIKMQGSEDNVNWFDLPSMSITAAVGATTQVMSNATSMPRFIRSIVATAGVGSSLFCLCMKGRGV